MSEKDAEVAQEDLPQFVILNPAIAAMFYDDLSGLKLNQWGGVDEDGEEIKNWGAVPQKEDCSRIRLALMNNTLFPCNTKGECRLIPREKDGPKDRLEKIMAMHSREVISLAEHSTSAEFISSMLEYEKNKDRKERRDTVIRALNDRLKSRDITGVTGVSSNKAMIRDKNGKMVPDDIKLV